MDIYRHFDSMTQYVDSRDWDLLEIEFGRHARILAGAEMADAISTVDMTAYEASLRVAMAVAFKKAETAKAKSIYFEYDLDNAWQSNFFICPDYSELEAADEDWACDWVDEVEGPEFGAFGDIYRSTEGFDTTDLDCGTTLYLVARTVAAFGRCATPYLDSPLALCIAFHDQSPTVRIKEMGQ